MSARSLRGRQVCAEHARRVYLHYLDEQVRQFLQVERAEIANRSMRRVIVSSEHAQGHVLMQLSGQLA